MDISNKPSSYGTDLKKGKKKPSENLWNPAKSITGILSHLLDAVDCQHLYDARSIVELEGENQRIQCSYS